MSAPEKNIPATPEPRVPRSGKTFHAPTYHVEFDDPALRSQYRSAPFVAGPMGFVYPLFGKIAVVDIEKIPAGPAIIVPYHASYLDPIAIGLTLWRNGYLPHYLAKSGLFTGIVGKVLKQIGQIPVLRGSAQAGDSLQYARAALEAGEKVVIYPQGTLTKDPELWPEPSKTGAARLALQTRAPVIPLAHWGLQKPMPVGSKIPKVTPGAVCTMLFCDPIDYDDLAYDHDGIRALTDRITSHIAAGVARLRGEELPERFRAALGEDPEARR